MTNRRWAIKNDYSDSYQNYRDYENRSQGLYDVSDHDEPYHFSEENCLYADQNISNGSPDSNKDFNQICGYLLDRDLIDFDGEKERADDWHGSETDYIESMTKVTQILSVEKAIALLPEITRVIVYDHLDGKSFAKIAQLREMTKRDVEKEYAKALIFLKEILSYSEN